ncbi:MAG: TatD family hydrolase [Myxococcales bacterium]|nr:TatD family hydrolase [Myxococcales bacterium]
MSPMVDAHCHLDDPRLDAIREGAIADARAVGVGGWVLGGVDGAQWRRARALAAETPGVLLTEGLHPLVAATLTAAARQEALAGIERDGIVAIGETGLHLLGEARAHRDAQVASLRDHLALARDWGLPVVLHVVGAHGATLSLLREDGVLQGGWVHSFTGPVDVAREYLRLGLSLSFSASFLRASPARGVDVVRAVPGDRLLIETDCPDQAPPARLVMKGSSRPLNRPAWLVDVAVAVAAVREEPMAEVARRSTENLGRILNRHDVTSSR